MTILFRRSLLPLLFGLILGLTFAFLPATLSRSAAQTPDLSPDTHRVGSAPQYLAQTSRSEPIVETVAEIGFAVSDLDEALQAEAGSGIEFLEYLAPDRSRPLPEETQANDLIHWQTTISERLLQGPVELISPGVIDVDDQLGFSKGILVRDPDGHGIGLVEY